MTELAAHLAQTPFSQSIVVPILQEELSTYDGFFSLVTIAPTGDVVAWEPSGPSLSNLKDRDYFQNALATRQAYVSDGRAGARSATARFMPLVVIAAPIMTTDGNVRGVLAASLNLEKFTNFGRDYATISRGRITILDRQNHFVYSNSPSYAFMQQLHKLVHTSAQAKDAFFYYQENAGSDRQLVVPATVLKSSWKVFVQQPVSEIDREISQYYLMTMALVLIAVAISSAVAHVLSRKLTLPIDGLVQRVRGFTLRGC